MLPEEKTEVIDRELSLCGYFCIVTSEKMTYRDAINLYKSRDVSEKVFRMDKSFLGDKSLRVTTDEAASAKIFIEFIAVILRSKFYICLKEEKKNLDKKPNFMTVPASIRELEKIELGKQGDGVYRLDHAVTKTQKTILKAFGLDAASIRYQADEISKKLKEAK